MGLHTRQGCLTGAAEAADFQVLCIGVVHPHHDQQPCLPATRPDAAMLPQKAALQALWIASAEGYAAAPGTCQAAESGNQLLAAVAIDCLQGLHRQIDTLASQHMI